MPEAYASEAVRLGDPWPSAPVGLLDAVPYPVGTWVRPIPQISQNVRVGGSEAFTVVDANSFRTGSSCAQSPWAMLALFSLTNLISGHRHLDRVGAEVGSFPSFLRR